MRMPVPRAGIGGVEINLLAEQRLSLGEVPFKVMGRVCQRGVRFRKTRIDAQRFSGGIP
jgi:hypothetical protein